ncbi:hypothetical protein CHL67_05170 [Prosthecochloris sp. GSB1]|uniref:hypothetical protein n=1 Tax=Prosthecochloris sp. GSB1 TaxID=281093 RepID=UPI000B8CA4AC|nr:hypothetical protein [Prosthecochloris sp. GSB1]ASQ90394.1 hypothetical protein CHL67_05170 [Prosthecochloris sp. GSB1]
MAKSPHAPENIAIEKQKTLRLLITIGAILALSASGIYVIFQGTSKGGSGKVDVNLTKGTVSISLDKPILDQIDQGKTQTEGTDKDIAFTEGKIRDQDVIDKIKNLGSTKPTSFSGKNFISNDLRFLFSVWHPDKWRINYNSAGLQNPLVPVYTIFNEEGSHLNIIVETVQPETDIQNYVAYIIQNMLQAGLLLQQPQITYDFPSQTAFTVFTNPVTMGQSYQKVIIDKAHNRVFIATANYNQMLSTPESIQELINMIATFTLF